MSVESRALSMRSDRVARRFVARYGAKVALDRAATLRGRLSRLALTLPDYMWLVNYSTDLRQSAKGGDANAAPDRDTNSKSATSPGVTAGASAGWQSIETAPRDGTRFLTWDSYYGVRMGRAFMRADHDDWLSYVDSNGSSHKGGIRASHWMPLPAAPVDGGKDA